MKTWLYKPEPDPGYYMEVLTVARCGDNRIVTLPDGRDVSVPEKHILETQGESLERTP